MLPATPAALATEPWQQVTHRTQVALGKEAAAANILHLAASEDELRTLGQGAFANFGLAATNILTILAAFEDELCGLG